jgi:superfamily II DNA/RNA helicase
LLPILNAINLKEAAPQVLVLSPTRELALQTEEEAFELTR